MFFLRSIDTANLQVYGGFYNAATNVYGTIYLLVVCVSMSLSFMYLVDNNKIFK